VSATNLIGEGAYSTSTINGTPVTTEPHKPPTLVEEGANTDDTKVHITWDALTETGGIDYTGGATPTLYEVYWDAGVGGDNSWGLLVAENAATGLTYTFEQSVGISSGQPYRFYYVVSNVHGTGIESDVAAITASARPARLGAATTRHSGADVIVTWPATSTDRGAAVTGYRVKFVRSDGEHVPLTACTTSITFDASGGSCTVSMSRFTDAAIGGGLSLSLDTAIVALVEAENAKGFSDPSPIPPEVAADPAAAVVQTVPTTAPTPARGAGTASGRIEVTWNAITTSPENGGTAVTAYLLRWDGGDAAAAPETWADAGQAGSETSMPAGAARVVTYQSLTPGASYRFALKAENVHGAGPLGTVLTFLAAGYPAAPTGLTEANPATSSSVSFSWTAPVDTGGSPITGYQLFWDAGASEGEAAAGAAYLALDTINDPNITTYTVQNTSPALVPSTAYGFAVAAFNAVGTGQASGAAFFLSTTA
jgi:hypothetical protein